MEAAVSMFTGFTDLGLMDDLSFMHQVNSIEDLFRQPILPSYNNNNNNNNGSFHQQTLSNNNNNNNQLLGCKRSFDHEAINHTIFDKPVSKQLKKNDGSPYKSSSMLLSFGSYSSNDNNNNDDDDDYNYSNNNNLVRPKEEANAEMLSSEVSMIDNGSYIIGTSPHHHHHQGVVGRKSHCSTTTTTTNTSPATMASNKEHVLAERKRREKLSQRFIALSAIIPGLKKMDKSSVLADAIRYVKQLQEKVNTLEKEAKKKSCESAAFVKKTWVTIDEDDNEEEQCLADETGGGSCDGPLPEIEAKFSDRDVLIRIHCEKKKGILEKLISQVVEVHLEVVNTSALAFGTSSFDLTIIAQMKDEFSMTAKDLVRHLHAALKSLII